MINVGIQKLTPDDFYKILFLDEKIGLDTKAIAKVKANTAAKPGSGTSTPGP